MIISRQLCQLLKRVEQSTTTQSSLFVISSLLILGKLSGEEFIVNVYVKLLLFEGL